ncbi:hypothetical protein [Akkermansia muciniphila]|jgi:hypothetical protein|uniref:hypothetical protein n=1 Tax=Akkermansia muciniphila TaxID=239935 RepID=UPI001968E489|nr:hypothetical protein [Akkermansia muciniphila]
MNDRYFRYSIISNNDKASPAFIADVQPPAGFLIRLRHPALPTGVKTGKSWQKKWSGKDQHPAILMKVNALHQITHLSSIFLIVGGLGIR